MENADTTVNNKARLASIITALQTQGERLSDEDLAELQQKTDALLRPEDVIHIDSGSTHIHVSPKAV
jgi:hypothetical protein